MLLVLAVAMIAVLALIAILAVGRVGSLEAPTTSIRELSEGEPMFATALRGYRMDQVDSTVAKLQRQVQEQALVIEALSGPAQPTDTDPRSEIPT